MIASIILVIAIMGCFSMIAAVQKHNQINREVGLLYQATQEVLEPCLYDFEQRGLHGNPGGWAGTWNGVTFAVPYFSHTNANSLDPAAIEARKASYVGTVAIQNLQSAGGKQLYEIRVHVNTAQYSQAIKYSTTPHDFTIVSRRAVP
jgi:hypothetical protein